MHDRKCPSCTHSLIVRELTAGIGSVLPKLLVVVRIADLNAETLNGGVRCHHNPFTCNLLLNRNPPFPVEIAIQDEAIDISRSLHLLFMTLRLFSKLSLVCHRETALRVHYECKFPKSDTRVQRLLSSTYHVRKGFASSTSSHCISKLDSFWPSQFSKGKLA